MKRLRLSFLSLGAAICAWSSAGLAQEAPANSAFSGVGDISQIALPSEQPIGKIEQLNADAQWREASEELADESTPLVLDQCTLSSSHRAVLAQLKLQGQSFDSECAFLAWLSEDVDTAKTSLALKGIASGNLAGFLPEYETPPADANALPSPENMDNASSNIMDPDAN